MKILRANLEILWIYNLKNIIKNMDEPLIVTSIDGVGTKTKFILEHLV